MKKLIYLSLSILSCISLYAQPRPVSDVRLVNGGFRYYDSNNIPWVSIWGGVQFSGSVTTDTNMNLGTVGGSAVAQTNGVLTVYDLSPKATASTTFPEGSTNASGQLITVVTNTVTIQGNVGLTNALAGNTNSPGEYLETAPRASTNQVSFTICSTNLALTVTNAGVAGYVGFATTNAAFNVAGGRGLLQSITIQDATNRAWVVWAFRKVITAPTVGDAWAPTAADLQFLAGQWATTNTMFRAPQLAGTNYVTHLDRLAQPVVNADSSVNLHIIGTYLDTMTNYVSTMQVNVDVINEK